MASVHFGQHAPAARVLLHLSDTHLLGGDRLLGERYDTARHLRRTLEAAEATGVRPDAVVFTGDLTDLGEPEAYRALRAEVEPWAARLGAPVVWVAGNHDERPALRAELLDAEASDEPVTGVWDLGGLRLIALDSTVPGWHHGDLDAAQLDWLRGELAEPAPLGTILALHHPPLPTHIPFFDILELRDQSGLAEVVRGSDVRAILAGHLHYSTSGTFAGVPVNVAAASCYTMDLARPADEVNGMDAGRSFHLVHVWDDTVTHAVVPVVDAEAAGFFTPEWTARMASLTAEERLEAFSRKR
ncbi:3',5'-cyclic AMP phosphodiesterase CpdA [Microbacterium proteolyticum]|uniref:3',5'-cyclic AMP phosphodiesterase CpdA n=1 Tax=Microbacterium proteolyticum TaxID=1572644 RepID=A0A7W5CG05_9MICO|nr:phosphodiesterase [Microbacterium proteolyticum]MBB3156555.1 3',5'-cyclic AMP phosphodiesterase CpdA [Microbacterium proteolyticum]